MLGTARWIHVERDIYSEKKNHGEEWIFVSDGASARGIKLTKR